MIPGAVIRFSDNIRWFFLRAAGGFAGFAVPSVVASRAAMTVVFTLAAGCAAIGILPQLLSAAGWRKAWSELRQPFGLAILVMLACWLASALAGIAPERSLEAWGWTAGLLLLGWVLVSALCEDERAIAEALWSLVVTSQICILLALAATYLWHGAVDPLGFRGMNNFPNARQGLKSYGSIVPVLAPLVIWAGWRLGGWWRIAALAYLPMALVFVLTVSSRAGLLGIGSIGLALAIGVLLTRLPQRAARWTAGLLGVIAVVGIVVFASYLPRPPIKGPEDYRISQTFQVHRQAIWGFAVHHALRAPVLGYGPDAARLIPGAHDRIPVIDHEYIPSHAHNWIFQALVETGFLGTAAMLVVVIMLFGRFVRAAARRRGVGWAGIAAMGGFFGSWLANFSLWAAWWQLTFIVLAAILLAALAGGAPPITNTGRRAPLRGRT
jgi:O-antigen ligase